MVDVKLLGDLESSLLIVIDVALCHRFQIYRYTRLLGLCCASLECGRADAITLLVRIYPE